MSHARYVALLYSIVLGPKSRLIMSEFKAMAEEMGLLNPRTLVATGNLMFETEKTEIILLEQRLESEFAKRFGKHIDIIVRDAADWPRLVAGNPFAAEAKAHGASVHVRVMRDRFKPETSEAVQAMARNGERIALVDGDLWMHFPNGFAGTKLLPAMTPKKHGIGTTRNWNTISKIAAALAD